MPFIDPNVVVSVRFCPAHGFWHAFFGSDSGYYPVHLDVDYRGELYDLVDIKVRLAEHILSEVRHAQRTLPSSPEHQPV